MNVVFVGAEMAPWSKTGGVEGEEIAPLAKENVAAP
ncbi:Granule-bound starch synthase 1 chloroplastic/amyloplastic [Zea mays]|uniref:Granule-bound starch synthase 1 chloroplastic/amyloplastic n=1 Tax=Zea mays TaxID=4577 RepID=A0A1D6NW12_MAIZE|nr:Granule-bound starch synthase 1, chloroplastic/amyloplastic [Zea mays]ONM08988.1 Granule-bound starch synthase 1 chloroplastic/amyloplastic [Zea mays]